MYTTPVAGYWRHMGWGDIGVGPSGVVQLRVLQGVREGVPGDAYYVRSTDTGITWSAPLKLNTDATTRGQWQAVPRSDIGRPRVRQLVRRAQHRRPENGVRALRAAFDRQRSRPGSSIRRSATASFRSRFSPILRIKLLLRRGYDRAAPRDWLSFTHSWTDGRVSDQRAPRSRTSSTTRCRRRGRRHNLRHPHRRPPHPHRSAPPTTSASATAASTAASASVVRCRVPRLLGLRLGDRE